MVNKEHLDRVERFAEWLEEKRVQAGYTQRELADASGISHSYYSKVVHIGQLRRKYGDESREVTAPRSLKSLEGALTAICERLGDGCREEGMRVWEGSHNIQGQGSKMASKNTPLDKGQLLTDTLAKLLSLPEDRLKLVADLIEHLR